MPTWCLIPAAGKGTRMRPLSHSLPKAMLPVAGKPSLFHIIDKVKDQGVTDFVVITGYLKNLMEAEIKSAYPELNIHFVEQTEQKGLGHACLLGEKKINPKDSLLIIYGDTLFEADLKPILSSEHIHIGVYPIDDPRRFGVIEKNDTGEIVSLVEKPENPPSNLAIPGVNFFPSASKLFEAIHYIIENNITTKGEYQITDAFSHILNSNGSTLKYFIIKNWYDCGTLKSMLTTNQKILEKSGGQNKGIIQNSEIIEPVYIPEDAHVSNSKVGPYVSLGKKCLVQDSIISQSILDEETRLTHSSIQNSLIGRNTKLESVTGEFILGDHSHLKSPVKG